MLYNNCYIITPAPRVHYFTTEYLVNNDQYTVYRILVTDCNCYPLLLHDFTQWNTPLVVMYDESSL